VPRALFEVWPKLADRVPIAPLGEFPTPVESLERVAREVGHPDVAVFVKRDDISSPVYGGNKVRTLETLFGRARAEAATHIWSTGAFGSNHAVATVLHAPRAGLEPGALLFPQPVSWAALENLRVVLAQGPEVRALMHWSSLPFGMFATARRERARGRRPVIMVPGGATPAGALGYVSAAFELARQVARGDLPAPKRVVIGVGSTCTSAGLLVGFHHAARLGIGFVDARGRPAPPELVSVRVTPWPVTSRHRIVGLAVRTARLLAELSDEPRLAVDRHALGRLLRVEGRYLGRGYGHASRAGAAALRLWQGAGLFALDPTYSAKAAAGLLDEIRRGEGPLLFWSTKSTVPLPTCEPALIRNAPPAMLRWIARAENELERRGELPAGYQRVLPESVRSRRALS
jgi:D-cysteine desulfhydrase